MIEKIAPNRIDEIISAEIPDIEIDKDLYDIVSKNMINGPCESLNNNSLCVSDGKCTKRYPRDLLAETMSGNDGYYALSTLLTTIYRRWLKIHYTKIFH
ncbi:helitron_like_N domain-containing protein [Trichonephila clavata]|uniref:Helitron_like_N domain-containing protein n=1 Tax=Trichonephila clavata TaxID=2740835 RepID=A0A8X6HBG9_TRICU|nr:helitron_like_N domain-containing protein [Trichonephila clavata]